MISVELLLRFQTPKVAKDDWPTMPVTVGGMLRLAIHYGWLASSVPFGKTLSGPETVWQESLVLTDKGRAAIGL